MQAVCVRLDQIIMTFIPFVLVKEYTGLIGSVLRTRNRPFFAGKGGIYGTIKRK